MGLQKYLKYLAVAMVAFLLNFGCTDEKPSQPGNLPTLDSAAVEVARFALSGMQSGVYAFYPATGLKLDTVSLTPVYDKSYLDSAKIASFVPCMNRYRNSDTVSNCTYQTNTLYGFMLPLEWDPEAGDSYKGLIRIQISLDTNGGSVPWNAPMIFQGYGPLYDSYVDYQGRFESAQFYASNFNAKNFVYMIYPMTGLYRALFFTLGVAADSFSLIPDSLPNDGGISKKYYYNWAASAASEPWEAGSLPYYDTLITHYVDFSLKGGVVAPNFVLNEYLSTIDRIKLYYTPDTLKASRDSDTLLSGAQQADSTWIYALNNGRRLFFKLPDSGFSPVAVLSAALDTLLAVTPGPSADSVTVRSPARVTAFAVSRDTLLLNGANTGAWFTAALSKSGNLVWCSFSRKEFGTGALSYIGGMYVNLYTRQGKGYVRSPGNGFRYEMDINLDGVSTIEGSTLP
jgi:hypothetical protein